MIYGIVFIIVDRLNFSLYDSNLNSGIRIAPLFSILKESFTLRSLNLIFVLIFIFASYLLIKGKKEAWHLYNISFSGILLKHFFLIFFGLFSTNILIQIAFHFLISIFGLVFINLKRSRKKLKILLNSYLQYFILNILLSSGIILFFAFDNIIFFEDYNSREEYYNTLLGTTQQTDPDDISFCFLINEFNYVLDYRDNIHEYSMIRINEIDSLKNTIYSETVTNKYYSKDIVFNEEMVKRNNDSLSFNKSLLNIKNVIFSNSLYEYSNLNSKIYSINFLNNLSVKNILNNNDSVFIKSLKNKIDKNYHTIPNYIFELNTDNKIYSIIITNNINEQRVLNIKYNKYDNKYIERIDITNIDKSKYHSVEFFRYNHKFILLESIIYSFPKTGNKLDKGLTIYNTKIDYKYISKSDTISN